MGMDDAPANESGKKKILLGTAVLAGSMILGSALGVNQKIDSAYHWAKNGIHDVMTYDVGERADDLVNKIGKEKDKEKDMSKYLGSIESIAYVSFESLPTKNKEATIEKVIYKLDSGFKKGVVEKIVAASDADMKKQLFNYTAQAVGNDEKSKFVQDNVSFLSVEQTKSLHDSLEKTIYEDNKANAKGIGKVWYKLSDFYQGLKSKISGNSKNEGAAEIKK